MRTEASRPPVAHGQSLIRLLRSCEDKFRGGWEMEDAMADAVAPAGWYQDPQIPSILRWWDGQVWTEHTTPVEAPAASTSTAPQVPSQVEPSPVPSPVVATGLAPEPPAVTGLGEILEARQGDHALPAPFADHGRQVGDGRDVGELVEGEGAPAGPGRYG